MHHIKPKVIKPGGNTRSGKGFSQEELKKAGLNTTEAKNLGVPVDKRRKTAHEKNVKTLRTYPTNRKTKTQTKPKPQPKKKAKK